MKDKLRELVGELMSACEMIGYATSGNERANHRSHRDKVKAALLEILDADGDGGAVCEWIEGYPDHVYASEWFIAHTIYNDRVVLRALPEEYSYDFTTADDTYMKKENVKCWMQFPDSHYIPAATHPARSGVVSDEDVFEHLSYIGFSKGLDGEYAPSTVARTRAALEHFAKGERHER